MIRPLIFLFLISAISLSAQEEKRLALVIGNANYSVGELKNPVNDALLMAEAFDSLGFDVILDTNIQTKYEFVEVIKEFDLRREDYDVGFVYYAGHGIQVGSENYMIPTNEKLEKEDDVYYYGINVQMIIRILTRSSDQVNVLILDACRNNPFEQKWNRNRSLNQGNGLAKMQAPMGSLIAFATTAGNVAPDGDGENSTYCSALWNNMFKERVSLDQFFRNVRSEVLEKTNGQQQTEESTQLTGETFYLVPSNFRLKYRAIDSLITKENYYAALDLTQEILFESVEKEAILRKAEIYNLLGEYDNEIKHLNKYELIFPEWIELLESIGDFYFFSEDYTKAKKVYTKIVQIDSSYANGFINLAISHENLNELDSAIQYYTRAINLDSTKIEYLSFRSDSYLLKKDTSKALEDLNFARHLDKTAWSAYARTAEIYLAMGQSNQAIETYEVIIQSENVPAYALAHALNNQSLILDSLGRHEEALKNLTYLIDNLQDSLSEEDVAKAYRNIGDLYFNKLSRPQRAIETYWKSIEMDSWEGTYDRLITVLLSQGDTLEALSVFDGLLAINRGPYSLSDKADILFEYGAYTKAIELYQESCSKVNPGDDALMLLNWNTSRIALSYMILEKPSKALNQINNTLNRPDIQKDSTVLGELYQLKGLIYSEIDSYEKALKNVRTALEYNPKEIELYLDLEFLFWQSNDTTKARSILSNGLQASQDKLDSLKIFEAMLSSEIEWKEWGRAEKLVEQMINLSAKPEFYSLAGKIALNNQKYDEAIKLLNTAIELDSSYIDAYYLRSKVWIILDDDLASLQDLKKTISIDEEDPEGYYYLSQYYSSNGEYLKALKFLGLAITNYTDGYFISSEDGSETIELSTVYIQRAEVYGILGDSELMCEDLKQAEQLGAKIDSYPCPSES